MGYDFMTASTNATRHAMTRTVAMAGIVTAGAAALTLPFAPSASADEATMSGVVPAAELTDAPAAYLPQTSDGVLGKAPGAEDDEPADGDESTGDTEGDESPAPEESAEAEESAESDDENADGAEDGESQAPDAEDAPDAEETEDAEETVRKGRGAEYRADGTLITIPHAEQPKPQPASAEDIDRWIDEALEIMKEKGIPGSYEGIHSNLMRESSGDPHTINMWDSNAHKNIPSKGLLQVIDPTFEQYHVEGTPEDIYDPVANIVAACNYAAERYGSMDNVDSAY
jgi:hypothetical protein